MNKRICTVAGCDNKTVARGMCNRHYLRWRNHGDPLGGGSSPSKPVDHPDGTRTCTGCGVRQPIDEFDKNNTIDGGRKSKCKQCRSDQMKSWYGDNRERQQRRARERTVRDSAKIRDRDRERYYSNREKHLELVHARVDRARAEKFGVEFDPTVTRKALRERYGDRCHYCCTEMDFEIGDHGNPADCKATIEHMVPLCRGGGHTWTNCVLSCWECNGDKQRRTVDEWLKELADAEGQHSAEDLHSAAASVGTALAGD